METVDSYSYHEVLDRAHIQLINLEMALGEHPVILQNPEARALYEQSALNLAALYRKLEELKEHAKKA